MQYQGKDKGRKFRISLKKTSPANTSGQRRGGAELQRKTSSSRQAPNMEHPQLPAKSFFKGIRCIFSLLFFKQRGSLKGHPSVKLLPELPTKKAEPAVHDP